MVPQVYSVTIDQLSAIMVKALSDNTSDPTVMDLNGNVLLFQSGDGYDTLAGLHDLAL